MREVSQAEFYAAVGPLDVDVVTRGKYQDDDYGSDFRLKTWDRRLVGRIVNGPVEPPISP